MYTFVNPELLEKIDRKAQELVERWDYPRDRAWQVFQMVATIESGRAERTFYRDGGIIVDGWNGNRGYADGANPDPYRAWGGFYRTEKGQMVGWTIYLAHTAESNQESPEEAMRRGSDIYRLRLVWEDRPMIWGFTGFEDFYTEAEAAEALEEEKSRRGYKRGEVTYLDASGCYRATAQNSRAKPRLKYTHKERIEP